MLILVTVLLTAAIVFGARYEFNSTYTHCKRK